MLGLTVTLLAALLAAPAPGTLDPTTGMPVDVQQRANPPPVEARPAPGVNFGQSPTSVTPPATRPPSPSDPSAPRTPLMRPRPDAAPSTTSPGTGPSSSSPRAPRPLTRRPSTRCRSRPRSCRSATC
ncbi:hypothetical protein OV079_43070 [Nannocystis pusilla]|uniref:Uncharacterized protein n=1 Tax=Nannocystis pusilla TaxID=889268 RepID=A0A9X3EZ73_9BACT|nr:hypothetical protein [Nannocystis pusilla]MCY1012210.1 hypothetical protein [Nannocystis pusilla]